MLYSCHHQHAEVIMRENHRHIKYKKNSTSTCYICFCSLCEKFGASMIRVLIDAKATDSYTVAELNAVSWKIRCQPDTQNRFNVQPSLWEQTLFREFLIEINQLKNN